MISQEQIEKAARKDYPCGESLRFIWQQGAYWALKEAKVERLEKAVEVMRETIGFYANERIYDKNGAALDAQKVEGEIDHWEPYPDVGFRARQALAEVEKLLGDGE